jgi:hypothetical protein
MPSFAWQDGYDTIPSILIDRCDPFGVVSWATTANPGSLDATRG